MSIESQPLLRGAFDGKDVWLLQAVTNVELLQGFVNQPVDASTLTDWQQTQ